MSILFRMWTTDFRSFHGWNLIVPQRRTRTRRSYSNPTDQPRRAALAAECGFCSRCVRVHTDLHIISHDAFVQHTSLVFTYTCCTYYSSIARCCTAYRNAFSCHPRCQSSSLQSWKKPGDAFCFGYFGPALSQVLLYMWRHSFHLRYVGGSLAFNIRHHTGIRWSQIRTVLRQAQRTRPTRTACSRRPWSVLPRRWLGNTGWKKWLIHTYPFSFFTTARFEFSGGFYVQRHCN